jgi:hypothetical protein
MNSQSILCRSSERQTGQNAFGRPEKVKKERSRLPHSKQYRRFPKKMIRLITAGRLKNNLLGNAFKKPMRPQYPRIRIFLH